MTEFVFISEEIRNIEEEIASIKESLEYETYPPLFYVDRLGILENNLVELKELKKQGHTVAPK